MTGRCLVYLLSQYPASNHSYLLREVRGLRALGWDVRVISIRPADRPLEQLTELERDECEKTSYVLAHGPVRVIRLAARYTMRAPARAVRAVVRALACTRAVSSLGRSAWYAVEALAVAEMIPDDSSHVHGHFVGQILEPLHELIGERWSVTLHGPEEFDGENSSRVSRLARDSRFIRTISSYGRAMCLLRAPSADSAKIRVVRLGVEELAFEERSRELAGDVVRLVSVGRLAPIKGFRLLLDAVAELKRRGIAVHLSIIGGGSEFEHLQAQIAASELSAFVTLHGWMNSDEVERRLRQASAFILPSFGEGIPLVLMEAMMIGIPCIATAVGGVPELIRDGVSGRLIPAGDTSAIVTAIEELASDRARAASMAAQARQDVSARYAIERNVAELSTLFSTQCRRGSARRIEDTGSRGLSEQ